MPDGRKRLPIEAFQAAFEAWAKAGHAPLLVGGQAVNFWGTRYRSSEQELRELSEETPFLSADIDFKGTRKTAEEIAKALHTKPIFQNWLEGAFSNLVGIIRFNAGGEETNIEVVFKVPGLDVGDAEKMGVNAQLGKRTIRVLDPISLLYSKAHCALKYDQKDRQDVSHVRILIPCVRAFLKEGLAQGESDVILVRGMVSAMERAMKLAQSQKGRRLAERHGIRWEGLLPIKNIEDSTNSRLRGFRERRLPGWLESIRGPRKP